MGCKLFTYAGWWDRAGLAALVRGGEETWRYATRDRQAQVGQNSGRAPHSKECKRCKNRVQLLDVLLLNLTPI